VHVLLQEQVRRYGAVGVAVVPSSATVPLCVDLPKLPTSHPGAMCRALCGRTPQTENRPR
jgi:hypothetical protein